MLQQFSLLANISAGMALSLVLGMALTLIAVISCWTNKDKGIIGKLFWTIFILMTLAFGAMLYGLLNFRSLLAKIFTVVVFGAVVWGGVIQPIFLFKEAIKERATTNKPPLVSKEEIRTKVMEVVTDTAVNVTVGDLISKARPKAEAIAAPDKKNEIIADLDIISQEIKTYQLTAEQGGNYFRMVGYLIGIMDRGLPDTDYKDWQAIFANRKTLTGDYMGQFLVSRGFTSTAVPAANATASVPVHRTMDQLEAIKNNCHMDVIYEWNKDGNVEKSKANPYNSAWDEKECAGICRDYELRLKADKSATITSSECFYKDRPISVNMAELPPPPPLNVSKPGDFFKFRVQAHVPLYPDSCRLDVGYFKDDKQLSGQEVTVDGSNQYPRTANEQDCIKICKNKEALLAGKGKNWNALRAECNYGNRLLYQNIDDLN